MNKDSKHSEKVRNPYIDLMRIFMMLFIVNYHFTIGIGKTTSFFCSYQNGGWGSVGTGMFFMLSGFLLYMHNSQMKYDFKGIISFYKNHLLSLYIPFYVSYIAALLFAKYYLKTFTFNLPPGRLIFSILGIDNYLVINKIPAYYLVGEWFTTVIILIYLIFPLLLLLFKKAFVPGSILVLALYVINFHVASIVVLAPDCLPATGIFLFWIGMTICKYKDFLNKNIPVLLISIILAAIVVFVKLPISGKYILSAKNLLGISIFLIFFIVFPQIKFKKVSAKILGFLGKIMYSVYLCHHFILARIFIPRINENSTTPYIIKMYFIYIAVVLVVSTIIFFISNKIIRLFKK